MNIIILAGMPASGKTTLAKQLQQLLGYPIIEKDSIKEALFDTLGWNCYAEKRRLDHAANSALLVVAESLMRSGISMILDNNFDDESAKKLNTLLDYYQCNCITVFLGGDTDFFYKRYIDRDNSHQRHLGHAVQDHYPLFKGESQEYEMTKEEFYEKFVQRGMTHFHCKGTRIDLDTSSAEGIDFESLYRKIQEYLK